MLHDAAIASFLKSTHFDSVMISVGKDDAISFKNNNSWLAYHPSSAIIFSDTKQTWDKIKTPYRTSFKDLVIGPIPSEQDLIETLQIISTRLKQLDWLLN